ncbi:hypothetical protein PR048_004188, partial [Dryococelus australis]
MVTWDYVTIVKTPKIAYAHPKIAYAHPKGNKDCKMCEFFFSRQSATQYVAEKEGCPRSSVTSPGESPHRQLQVWVSLHSLAALPTKFTEELITQFALARPRPRDGYDASLPRHHQPAMTGARRLYLSRHEYFEYCFVLVRADIEVLIKRYEYLKGMVESSCSEEYLKRCMEGNGFLTSLIENSTQDNKKLEEKIAALKEVIVQTRKYSERLLEEANKQRKRNDSKEFARRLVECQEEKKTLMSRVAALEQVKIQLNAVASFWHQKGCELSHRYDQHASKIEDIMKDVAVVKQQMARAMELAKEYPAPEKQAESPCKDIGGMFSIAMNVMCQFESSVNTQMRGFQRDIDQIAQANSSLETKCRSLEQELKTVSEEKASLAERLVTKRNVEVELSALQERCECSERQLATTEDSRLTHKRSLATQVELEAKLKAAKAQVKQLQDELQEKRRMMSKKITTIEDGNKLLYKAKQENVTLQQPPVSHAPHIRMLSQKSWAIKHTVDDRAPGDEISIHNAVNVEEDDGHALSRAADLYRLFTAVQKNAREVETLQERINMLECSAKSTLSDSQATKEELTARQNEIKQLVHALEMRNKVTCHLEEEIVSLNVERDQHLDTITLLKNKIKLLKSGFDKELKSKVEHIGYLQQEVETLEKDRIQLISINDDVAGEIKEWQVMIEHLCLMINEVKDSLTEQTLEKENTTVKDAVTSTKPRLRVLFSSREFQSSVSVFSEIKGIVSEITADAQQSEHLTVLSQTPRMSAVTRTEQFREVCICIGDDSVVTSVTNMVEDIKAQLRAYVHEETKKRNQELVAVFKVQKAESEFKEKCEELDETSLELKVVKNMYISAKQALCELKQQNLCLVNDLNIAEDTITRIDHEMNESSSKITTLEHDVKKGLDTIRKQCDTIKELENTIKDLRKVSNERTVTAKYEPESSRRMQEKVYTQVTMEVLALEVPNKEQSSVEIAQDTA